MSEKLELILAHAGTGKLELYACRGIGKGCPRNRYRTSKSPCDDCMGPLPHDMTMEQVQKRIAAGDA